MYIAIILENFDIATRENDEALTGDDFEHFFDVWQTLDKQGSGFITLPVLSKLLDALDSPFKSPKPNIDFICSLDIPLYEDYRVYILDVVTIVTSHVLSHTLSEDVTLDELKKTFRVFVNEEAIFKKNIKSLSSSSGISNANNQTQLQALTMNSTDDDPNIYYTTSTEYRQVRQIIESSSKARIKKPKLLILMYQVTGKVRYNYRRMRILTRHSFNALKRMKFQNRKSVNSVIADAKRTEAESQKFLNRINSLNYTGRTMTNSEILTDKYALRNSHLAWMQKNSSSSEAPKESIESTDAYKREQLSFANFLKNQRNGHCQRYYQCQRHRAMALAKQKEAEAKAAEKQGWHKVEDCANGLSSSPRNSVFERKKTEIKFTTPEKVKTKPIISEPLSLNLDDRTIQNLLNTNCYKPHNLKSMSSPLFPRPSLQNSHTNNTCNSAYIKSPSGSIHKNSFCNLHPNDSLNTGVDCHNISGSICNISPRHSRISLIKRNFTKN